MKLVTVTCLRLYVSEFKFDMVVVECIYRGPHLGQLDLRAIMVFKVFEMNISILFDLLG